MARFAHVSAVNVRITLATGVGTIVTANTIAGNAAVIHRRP